MSYWYGNHLLSPARPYDHTQVQYRWAPHLAEQHSISHLDPCTHVPPGPQYHHQYAAQHDHYRNSGAVNVPTNNRIVQATRGSKQSVSESMSCPNSALTASILLKGSDPSATQKPPLTVQLSSPKEACAGTRTASNLEKHALAALNCIFIDMQFSKVRPAWLRNPRTGRLCELDFYSDELKLGVEIQGLQHYVYPNSWHKNRSEWEELIYRDRLKEELCRGEGVTLVHVPFTVAANRVEQYIREEVQRVALPGSALGA